MKCKDVLNLLGISRVTLSSYVSSGKIKVTELHNGYYDYDKDSVFKLIKKDKRSNVIYARVSTYKQKNDLNSQIDELKKYCDKNNIKYESIYKDISSGIDLERKEFSILLQEVLNYKINNIYITYKDRLTRLSFFMLEELFMKFGTKIICIFEDAKDMDQELMDDIVSLLHIFSTKMYSNRRKKKIDLVKKDLTLFNSPD